MNIKDSSTKSSKKLKIYSLSCKKIKLNLTTQKLLNIIIYYLVKTEVNSQKNINGCDYNKALKWMLCDNKFLKNKLNKHRSTIWRSFKKLEQAGYIKMDYDYLISKKKNKEIYLRRYIKVNFTEKLINFTAKRRKKFANHLSTKTVDKSVDKLCFSTTKNATYNIIDNTYRIIKNNSLNSCLKQKIVDKNLLTNKPKLINFTNTTEKIEEIFKKFKDMQVKKWFDALEPDEPEFNLSKIFDFVRRKTRKFYQDSFLMALLEKLKRSELNNCFRRLGDFVRYFVKVVENEKIKWQESSYWLYCNNAIQTSKFQYNLNK